MSLNIINSHIELDCLILKCKFAPYFRYLNDLYVLEMKAHTGTYSWDLPVICGEPPPPRESHTTVAYLDGITSTHKIVVYGGMSGCRLGDLWILDTSQQHHSIVKHIILLHLYLPNGYYLGKSKTKTKVKLIMHSKIIAF